MRRLVLSPVVVVLAAALAAACDYQPAVPPGGATTATVPTSDNDADVSVVEAATTWHRDVRPIVERHCNGCHSPGGIAPFAFDSYAATDGHRPLMVGAVQSGEMPPWPFDPGCRDIKDTRLLSDDDKATFDAWRDAGYAEGDPSDFIARDPAPTSTLGTHGLALTRTDGYEPDRSVSDDYRCFVFPQTIADDAWVTGVRIDADQLTVVHHVLLFVVPETSVASVTAQDAESPSVAGYPCLGGSGAQGGTLLAGWAPGNQPVKFPDGAAFRLPKGSRLVMQLHYNTLNLAPEDATPSDRTGAWLETLPDGQQPSNLLEMRSVLDPRLSIEPGDEASVQAMDAPARFSGTIIGVALHMHTLGTAISLNLSHSDGSSSCVGDIPSWDFHWQQSYLYEPDAYITVKSGDELHLSCTYDNSAANQPDIQGVVQEPRLVTWGEETTDEMCLGFMIVMTPYDGSPAPTSVCEGFGACYAECDKGDSACALQCMLASGSGCATCAVPAIFQGCGADQCPSEAGALQGCLGECDKTPLQCATTTCLTQSQSLYACLEVPLRAGLCDGPCGIELAP